MFNRLRRPWIACCIWATLCLVLPAFAQTWNGLKLMGVPVGTWLAAQGLPLALAALALWIVPAERTEKDTSDLGDA